MYIYTKQEHKLNRNVFLVRGRKNYICENAISIRKLKLDLELFKKTLYITFQVNIVFSVVKRKKGLVKGHNSDENYLAYLNSHSVC
jgi:hypothetical protein